VRVFAQKMTALARPRALTCYVLGPIHYETRPWLAANCLPFSVIDT
jgi:hypothetical protein